MFLYRIVKVDHSPRHYANSNPIRYVSAPRSAGMSSYNAVPEYEYGQYDPSYSTSYSTTELFQPSAGPGVGAGGGYAQSYASGYPGTHTQITYQPATGGASAGPPPPQQQQQPQPQPSQLMSQNQQPNYVTNYQGAVAASAAAAAAYQPNYNTYGYRGPPVIQPGYNPNPMNNGFPRQY